MYQIKLSSIKNICEKLKKKTHVEAIKQKKTFANTILIMRSKYFFESFLVGQSIFVVSKL